MLIWEFYNGAADDWDKYVEALSGSFYQTFGWGEARKIAGWKPMRLMARVDGKIVSLASLLIKQKWGLAICWVPGGPVGLAKYFDHSFRKYLKDALNTWFLYCRISMLRADTGGEIFFLNHTGWHRPAVGMSSGLTMLYPLSGNSEERLMKASSNWRHNLKRSRRYKLQIEHWINPNLVEIKALYKEMEQFKSLPEQYRHEELQQIFKQSAQKIIVYRAIDESGNLLAIRAAAICGNIAMDLLAAAGASARKVYASHATLWALLDHCCQLGLIEYDLSGVDPINNKGVYDFKQGTGANLVECVGEWEWANLPGLCHAVNWLIAKRNNGSL